MTEVRKVQNVVSVRVCYFPSPPPPPDPAPPQTFQVTYNRPSTGVQSCVSVAVNPESTDRYISGPYLGFFVWGRGGGKLRTPTHRGLLYTDRVSSWTFLFLPLQKKVLPLRPLKKSKHTDAFCLLRNVRQLWYKHLV